MTGRLQKHARERLNFVGDLPVAERLAACKTFLRLESAMIRMRHDAGEPGLDIAHARAAMVDVLLAHLFDYALATYVRKHGEMPSSVALVALGGYGRAELSPLSDIDLLFLFPPKAKPLVIKPLQEHLSNEILYILWDCGLKVGHSTRTIDETFDEARGTRSSPRPPCSKPASSPATVETLRRIRSRLPVVLHRGGSAELHRSTTG
jgi:[protein-PII] uridylyltransferase